MLSWTVYYQTRWLYSISSFCFLRHELLDSNNSKTKNMNTLVLNSQEYNIQISLVLYKYKILFHTLYIQSNKILYTKLILILLCMSLTQWSNQKLYAASIHIPLFKMVIRTDRIYLQEKVVNPTVIKDY